MRASLCPLSEFPPTSCGRLIRSKLLPLATSAPIAKLRAGNAATARIARNAGANPKGSCVSLCKPQLKALTRQPVNAPAPAFGVQTQIMIAVPQGREILLRG